jgi:hypothetical protein
LFEFTVMANEYIGLHLQCDLLCGIKMWCEVAGFGGLNTEQPGQKGGKRLLALPWNCGRNGHQGFQKEDIVVPFVTESFGWIVWGQ